MIFFSPILNKHHHHRLLKDQQEQFHAQILAHLLLPLLLKDQRERSQVHFPALILAHLLLGALLIPYLKIHST